MRGMLLADSNALVRAAVVDDDSGLPALVELPAAGRLEGNDEVLTLVLDAEDIAVGGGAVLGRCFWLVRRVD